MARSVILNLPTTPLHRLLTNSHLPSRTHNPQLFAPYPVTASKVYLYYPNAWWVQQVRLSAAQSWRSGADGPPRGRHRLDHVQHVACRS